MVLGQSKKEIPSSVEKAKSQNNSGKIICSQPKTDLSSSNSNRDSMTVMSSDKIDIWSDKAAAVSGKLAVNNYPNSGADFLSAFSHPNKTGMTQNQTHTQTKPETYHFTPSSFPNYENQSPTGCPGYNAPGSPSPGNQKALIGANKSAPLEHHNYHQYHNHHQFPAYCEGCGLVIEDPYILQTTDKQCWHEECLTCRACGCKLDQTCFIRNSQPYCRTDYENLSSGKCSSCEQKILSTELVMRVSEQIYHLNCFACSVCETVLQTGDQFVLLEDQLLCRIDFEKQFPQFSQNSTKPSSRSATDLTNDSTDKVSLENYSPEVEKDMEKLSDHVFKSEENSIQEHENESLIKTETSDNELDDSEPKDESEDENEMENSKEKNSSIQQKPCRKRVILTTQQRRAFKAAFDLSSKPCRKVREQLARDTGLSVRVVQVWFQNERAKVKKLAKRQQQQQHSHLEAGLASPHLIEDGQYGVFIPNDASFIQAQMEGRFPPHHMPPNGHLIHPDGGVFAVQAAGINDMYSMCAAGAPVGQAGDQDFMPGSDFPQIMEIKDSEMYNSIKISSHQPGTLLHPIDKLYSMQSSYFTTS